MNGWMDEDRQRVGKRKREYGALNTFYSYSLIFINYAFLELLIRKIKQGKLLKNSEQHYSFQSGIATVALIKKAEQTIDESGIVTITKQHFLYQTC